MTIEASGFVFEIFPQREKSRLASRRFSPDNVVLLRHQSTKESGLPSSLSLSLTHSLPLSRSRSPPLFFLLVALVSVQASLNAKTIYLLGKPLNH